MDINCGIKKSVLAYCHEHLASLINSLQLAGKKQMTLREKKNKMAAVVSDWQVSGLSQVEYAGMHGFKLNTFRYWISRHRQSGDKQPGFIQIVGAVTQSIHIRYPHGVELILPAQYT